MNLRRLFRCAGSFTSAAVVVPPGLFPVSVNMPSVTGGLTLSPGSPGTNPNTLDGSLVYGNAVGFLDGDHNPNIVGPESAGYTYATNPSNPGTYVATPIYMRPVNAGKATTGRVYHTGNSRVRWLNMTFTDVNHKSGDIYTAYAQTPYLFVSGSGADPNLSVDEFYGCIFRGGNLSTSDGLDIPNGALIYGNATNGGNAFVGCLFENLLHVVAGPVSLFQGNWSRNNWSETLLVPSGTGAVIRDNLFNSMHHSAGQHVDCIHLYGGDNPPGTGPTGTSALGETVCYNFSIRGTGTKESAAIFHQDTDYASTRRIQNYSNNNNIVVGGEGDEMVIQNKDGATATRNLVITDQSDFFTSLNPWPRFISCGSSSITKSIIEGRADVTPTGTNTFSSNVYVGRGLAKGQTGTATDGSGQTTYSVYDVFVDPAFGAAMIAGVGANDFDGTKAEVRRRFRPILNGPAKLGDGSYAGPLNPDGSWSDGSPYAGGQAFAG